MRQQKEELQKEKKRRSKVLNDELLNDELEQETGADDDFLEDRNICSATDCTGLIPSLPVSDSEIPSYEQLYHFLPKAKG